MYRRLERAWAVIRTVVRKTRREDITFLTASIAYHAFVSMLPILLLVLIVVSALWSERFAVYSVEVLSILLPTVGQDVVTDAVNNTTDRLGLSVFSSVVFVWGTLKIFRSMDAAFAEIYGTTRYPSVLNQFRDALVVLLALATAASVALALDPLIRIPATLPFARVLANLLPILALAVAFFPIYYVFPNVDVTIREVLPGVFVAAIGWIGLKWVFNLYIFFSDKSDFYGLVGILVLLVTWLYFGALILLVGAEVNAVLAGRTGTTAIERRSKRQFGRQITDVASFEAHLTTVVEQASDAGIRDETIQQTLRRYAVTVRTTPDDRTRDTTDTDAESDSG